MNLDSTPGGRRPYRRGATFRLKENKVTIASDVRSKVRARHEDTDITVDQPEFQLLVKLYVPANLLIRNNKVSRKQLLKYLPVIVNESVPELDFQLHIFISSIVTSYVSSWYLEKLNTDNFDFVQNVHTIICDFVRDFAARILKVVELVQLLSMINELASILDRHIQNTALTGGVPEYARAEMDRNRNLPTSNSENELATITRKFLSESHVYFNRDLALVAAEKPDLDSSILVLAPPEDPRLVYLRVLVRNILDIAFAKLEKRLSPTSSTIALNLVTVILADLVLEKTVSKLSSPQFILDTVIGKCVDVLETKLADLEKAKMVSSNTLLFSRAKETLHGLYANVSAFLESFSRQTSLSNDAASVFRSPVLSLVDTCTNFSKRKLVFVSILGSIRAVLFLGVIDGGKLESFAQQFVMNKLRQSSVLQDAFLADIVLTLRTIVFGQDVGGDKLEPSTLISLRDRIYSLLHGRTWLQWFAYEDEDAAETKRSIESLLAIFDSESTNHAGPLGEASAMNELLVVQLLDCVVQNLYPESTSLSNSNKR